jgi:citrate lyase subunit beta/citryl-CoA lyase
MADAHAWATVLFVPADRPAMLDRAQERGADAVLVDLEDAVARDAKAPARAALRERLSAGGLAGPSAVCVRINAVDEGAQDDVEALAGLAIDALVLPKAAGAADVAAVRAVLDGLGGASIGLIPQVESARGILGLGQLAAAAPITAIALGGEDLCVDLGVARGADSLELLVPRALVALHARALGLAAIDTVYTAIGDEAGLVREARVARQLGFSGKLLIHPAQVEPVRRAFAPSAEQVAWAEGVLGGGVGGGARVLDGAMVDAPVLAQAQRILSRAR